MYVVQHSLTEVPFLACTSQLQATIQHIILIGAAHYICNSLLLDKTLFLVGPHIIMECTISNIYCKVKSYQYFILFQVLTGTFDNFGSLWMEMKSRIKAKDDGDTQSYRFRPRSVMIDDIFEGKFSSLCVLEDSDGLTSDCEEVLIEQEFSEVAHCLLTNL